MTRFTGSHRVDERRRRRLAVESDEAHGPAGGGFGSSSRKKSALAEPGPERFQAGDCPVLALVSPHLWKHLLGGAAALLLGCLLVAGEHYHAAWAARLGPGMTRLFAPAAGSLVSWYGDLLLLLSAQTALVIGWARSRSSRDFAGSYRLWGWVAFWWLGFSLCLSTGMHVAWSETVLFFWHGDLQGKEILCWLVPATAVANWLMVRLQQEMRGCPGSRRTFLAAAALYLGAAATYAVEGVFHAGGGNAQQLLRDGCFVAGHVCLLVSMTLHARHVLYTSVAPPPSRLRKTRSDDLKAGLARLRGLFSSHADSQTSRKKATRRLDPAEADERPAKRTRKKPPRKPVVEHRADEAEPPNEDVSPTARDSSPPLSDTRSQAENWESSPSAADDSDAWQPPGHHADSDSDSGPATRQRRLDEAEVEVPPPHIADTSARREELKGLSKRERRKLQQQWRDEERQSATT